MASFALLAMCQSSRAVMQDLNDRGTFEIFAAGRSIGTEDFEIQVRTNQVEARGNVHLQVEQNGKSTEVRTTSTLLLDSNLDPLSYRWSQRGSQSSQLSVDFRLRPARAVYKTVSGHEDRRDFALDKDLVVLDDNSLHHYQIAIARYDVQKGGPQAFHAFIPQEAAPGVITLNSAGTEPIKVNGVTRTLRRMLLTADLAKITVWVDDRGHLQVVSAPAAQFEATRKK
jgi:hypothetical protein